MHATNTFHLDSFILEPHNMWFKKELRYIVRYKKEDKMKKKLIAAVTMLTTVVLLAACGGTQASPGGGSGMTSVPEKVEGLTLDQYDGLTVSLVQLNRMMPLAGEVVTLSFMVENTGDETIAFVQGSSSNPIPDALTFTYNNVELVSYTDEGSVAIATMDYAITQLAPGESVTFDVDVIVNSGLNEVNAFLAYAILDGSQEILVDVIPTAYTTVTWTATIE